MLLCVGIGSPPHLRGKPVLLKLLVRLARITPAPAGKTDRRLRVSLFCEDHPRTCGENSFLYTRSDNSLRITPAPAGKTRRV